MSQAPSSGGSSSGDEMGFWPFLRWLFGKKDQIIALVNNPQGVIFGAIFSGVLMIVEFLTGQVARTIMGIGRMIGSQFYTVALLIYSIFTTVGDAFASAFASINAAIAEAAGGGGPLAPIIVLVFWTLATIVAMGAVSLVFQMFGYTNPFGIVQKVRE